MCAYMNVTFILFLFLSFSCYFNEEESGTLIFNLSFDNDVYSYTKFITITIYDAETGIISDSWKIYPLYEGNIPYKIKAGKNKIIRILAFMEDEEYGISLVGVGVSEKVDIPAYETTNLETICIRKVITLPKIYETSSDKVTIEGFSEKGSIVKIYQDDKLVDFDMVHNEPPKECNHYTTYLFNLNLKEGENLFRLYIDSPILNDPQEEISGIVKVIYTKK